MTPIDDAERHVAALDKASELERGDPGAAWRGVLYPDAGEAVIMRNLRSGAPWNGAPETGCSRAARKLRRYASANKLNRLVTLTFQTPIRDEDTVVKRVKALFRQLRRWLGSKFPYVRVVELHPGGHGLHVHLLVVRAVAQRIERAWNEGRVDIQRIRGREGVRRAAAYLAKDFDGGEGGRHRYEVAQGFAPERVTVFADRRPVVLARLCEVMGASPSATAEVTGLAISLVWWDQNLDGLPTSTWRLTPRAAA